MNNNGNVSIEDSESICMCCLQFNHNVKVIEIPALGYGSSFDNFSTKMQLCEDCISKTNPEWWILETVGAVDSYNEAYKHETEIFDFVKTLPLAGQELFHARFATGACVDYMSGQDWIDYELGILSHDKCKEYGYYSPDEITAYHKNFPVCERPYNVIYDDESAGCHCFYGASGLYNQAYSINISDDCYNCTHFKLRENPIATIYK